MYHSVSDYFTSQMMKHNHINIHRIDNKVCLRKPIFSGQKYPTITQ